ncbi:MAG: glycoside hydrolase family 9 protein, partial [Candidatus Sumerlaeia bacterium]|nr:glycoside hydrolase family 9 protein [Candidatus Sumerlaeia bacterium]
MCIRDSHSTVQIDEDGNQVPDSVDELIYAVKYGLLMQLPTGGVSKNGIYDPRREKYPLIFKPAEDMAKRILDTKPDLLCTGYYIVGMVEASLSLNNYDALLAKKCQQAATTAWEWLTSQPLSNTSERGIVLWAAVKLFSLNREEKYLNKARELAGLILEQQFLDLNSSRFCICGNYYDRINEQTSIFTQNLSENLMGTYSGLVELENLLAENDPLWFNLHYANRVFAEYYLLKMSTLSPYGQISLALIKNKDGQYEPRFFAIENTKDRISGGNGDYLIYGWLALQLAQTFSDSHLAVFARNQLHWLLGNNPLDYCMLIGLGKNNPPTYDSYIGKGLPLGAIPAGIIGKDGLGIVPFWNGLLRECNFYSPLYNSLYLALISELESPSVVTGHLYKGDEPLAETNLIVTDEDGKPRKELITDKAGAFEPISLIGQKDYSIKININNECSIKLTGISGQNKRIKINLNHFLKLTLIADKEIIPGQEFIIKARCHNSGLREITDTLMVKVRGAKLLDESAKKLMLPVNRSEDIYWKFFCSDTIPILIRIYSESQPEIFSELLITPKTKT